MSDDFEKKVRETAKRTGIKESRLADIMSRTKGPDGKVVDGAEGRQLQKKQKQEQDYKLKKGKIKKDGATLQNTDRGHPVHVKAGDYESKKRGN